MLQKKKSLASFFIVALIITLIINVAITWVSKSLLKKLTMVRFLQ